MKRTPLYAVHQRLGGKLVEFGGWEMPVQYTSITQEHLAVRQAAGLFDISHMGEVLVSGGGAEEFLNRTLTNDVRKLAPGQGQYTLMCSERGGVIDDLYAYRLADEEYLLVINASRIEADVAWLTRRVGQGSEANPLTPAETRGSGGLKLENASDWLGAVAVQGPRVVEFIDGCFPEASTGGSRVARVTDLKKNQVARFGFAGEGVWVSRTGYTGEDGFEVVGPALLIEGVWHQLLAAGAAHGLKPAGLGARDTLRTEMCYPLYGHELNEETTPIEAGLGYFVALDKGEFTGRAVLAGQKAKGPVKRLAAFKMTERAPPPRAHYAIWSTGAGAEKIGEVTSGTQSPSLGIGVGMAYVPPPFAAAGSAIELEIRGRRAPAVVVPKPVYRKVD